MLELPCWIDRCHHCSHFSCLAREWKVAQNPVQSSEFSCVILRHIIIIIILQWKSQWERDISALYPNWEPVKHFHVHFLSLNPSPVLHTPSSKLTGLVRKFASSTAKIVFFSLIKPGFPLVNLLQNTVPPIDYVLNYITTAVSCSVLNLTKSMTYPEDISSFRNPSSSPSLIQTCLQWAWITFSTCL